MTTYNKNKFCDALISNDVRLLDEKKIFDLDAGAGSVNNMYKKKLEIINNPKIICDYIKDQYFKNVLAIKYKGLYLYKMLFAEHNKMLWDYLFDETKILFFLYRDLHKHTDVYILKEITPMGNFNMLMENVKSFFYQTAPNTELGDYFTALKNNKKEYSKYIILTNQQKHWIKKRKWNNKMEAHLSEGGFVNWVKDFNTTFKNFNYVALKSRTPCWGGNYVGDNYKGTHFDYLFNLKKNCLVWDCNKDDFRKERINEFATKLSYGVIGKKTLESRDTLDGCFEYSKKHYGFHYLYNFAKKNMERWWRDKHKCWLSKGKCYKCNCDIVYKCSTEGEAKELENTNGTCKNCSTTFKINLIKNDEDDSDSGVSDSDSD